MDRRGRGASGDTPPYAIEREFEDVAAVADALAAEAGHPIDVVGHSYGGRAALGASAADARRSAGSCATRARRRRRARATARPASRSGCARTSRSATTTPRWPRSWARSWAWPPADLAAYRADPVWPVAGRGGRHDPARARGRAGPRRLARPARGRPAAGPPDPRRREPARLPRRHRGARPAPRRRPHRRHRRRPPRRPPHAPRRVRRRRRGIPGLSGPRRRRGAADGAGARYRPRVRAPQGEHTRSGCVQRSSRRPQRTPAPPGTDASAHACQLRPCSR